MTGRGLSGGAGHCTASALGAEGEARSTGRGHKIPAITAALRAGMITVNEETTK